MDWIQFTMLLMAIIGMFLAMRGDASSMKSDMNAYRAEANEDRRELLIVMRGIEAEIKDFHGRLCTIEERNGRR